ncbi:MAG: hypothetical protein AUK55_00030 [Syntrophobacteraceae bacterium CG2_30_61_12]|nr:MAG: hypothetical protein AUK55_00030 [Syntrophobacteraceae bacterium CG2_30_61_12]PIU30751.1 MAG: hypothetical protein COT06_11855 [Syntrophobacteraceae bacterium CG07_land_8_20_14_0_80_61_8]
MSPDRPGFPDAPAVPLAANLRTLAIEFAVALEQQSFYDGLRCRRKQSPEEPDRTGRNSVGRRERPRLLVGPDESVGAIRQPLE